MSQDGITFVGLDAHKNSIRVAMLPVGHGRVVEWQVANEPAAVRRLARKLEREAAGEVRCCYEAGPCGYALQRQLEAAGVICEVVAPSLIPFKPGERIKTDRRDAIKLAELLRAGMLTEVHAPTEDEEAVRDLCRCREDAREDLTRVRHRMSKFLLRRACIYGLTRKAWGKQHCWRSSSWRSGCIPWRPSWPRSPNRNRIGSRSRGCAASGGSTPRPGCRWSRSCMTSGASRRPRR